MSNIKETIQSIQTHKDAAIISSTAVANVVLDVASYVTTHSFQTAVVAGVATAVGLVLSTESGKKAGLAMGILSGHVPDEEKQVAFKELVQKQAEKIRSAHGEEQDDDPLATLEQKSAIKWLSLKHLNAMQNNDIFIAEDEGDLVSLPLNSAYHILIAAKTGSGKTTIIRQILMQMVCSCECYFVHPKFANVGLVDDERQIEVWNPITQRMRFDPEQLKQSNKKMNEIFLRFEAELNRRNLQKGKPEEKKWRRLYLFVDEGPEVLKKCLAAKEVIGRIVREGRQLKIYLCLATQSSQVQALGLSTADIAQFVTRFYLGGDSTTRSALMPGLKKADEQQFSKKGTIAYSSSKDPNGRILQFALMKNETVYEYFGEQFDCSEFTEWFDDEEGFGDDPFSDFSFNEDEQSDQNDDFETSNEQLETENTVEDDIMWAFEILRSRGVMQANKNQIVQLIKETWPDSIVNYNTDGPKIVELAKEYGFEIIKGAGGRR